MERNCLYIDKTAYVIVPVDGAKLIVHDKLSKWRAKNETSSASAGSPVDFVSHAGFVWVPQKFIKENKIKSIDFGVDCQAVRAAEGH